MKRVLLLAAAAVVVAPNTSAAAVVKVPGDYNRIQWALDAAAPGDTVLVDPGTYAERLIWPSTPALRLFSVDGAEHTVVDGGARESVCGIYTGVDTTTIIRGFTFTNGQVGGS